MQPSRRAVIDVGTNSVKLLIADVIGREVRPVWEGSRQTRLGRGFYSNHHLQSGPIVETAQAVADFFKKAGEEKAQAIRVIATSAVRDAVNGGELTTAINKASDCVVEVISGEQEADWAFVGVTTDQALASVPLWLVEVGGGSSQFILGHRDHIEFRHSFPLGTVRLLEKLPHSNPPRPQELKECRRMVREFLETDARRRIDAVASRKNTACLVGTGGTASILGCLEARLTTFDRHRLETTRVSRGALNEWAEKLWGMPVSERQQLPGLPPNRADVILTGAVVYEQVLEVFQFTELRISTRGVRFGALLTLA